MSILNKVNQFNEITRLGIEKELPRNRAALIDMITPKIFVTAPFDNALDDICKGNNNFNENPEKYLALPFKKFGVILSENVATKIHEEENFYSAISGFYLEEISFNKMRCMVVIAGTDEKGIVHTPTVGIYEIDHQEFLKEFSDSNAMIAVIKYFLFSIHSYENSYGYVSINQSKTFRLIDKKVFRRFSKVVILKSKHIEINKSEIYRGITWLNSVWIPGHWRRIFVEGTREINNKFIGKNREGERIMPGLTWVNEHIRGDGPTIDRIWGME